MSPAIAPTISTLLRPFLSTIGFSRVHARPYDTMEAELTVRGQRVWLGTYNSPEEVAHAYDTAC
jgi:hypothetical protein